MFFAYEFGGVYALDQEPDIVEVKLSAAKIETLTLCVINDKLFILVLFEFLCGGVYIRALLDHVHGFVDLGNVAVNRAALGSNSALVQIVNYIGCITDMIFICVALKVLQHNECLQLLVRFLAVLRLLFALFHHGFSTLVISRTTSIMWSACSGVNRSISVSSSLDFWGAAASALKNS